MIVQELQRKQANKYITKCVAAATATSNRRNNECGTHICSIKFNYNNSRMNQQNQRKTIPLVCVCAIEMMPDARLHLEWTKTQTVYGEPHNSEQSTYLNAKYFPSFYVCSHPNSQIATTKLRLHTYTWKDKEWARERALTSSVINSNTTRMALISAHIGQRI